MVFNSIMLFWSNYMFHALKIYMITNDRPNERTNDKQKVCARSKAWRVHYHLRTNKLSTLRNFYFIAWKICFGKCLRLTGTDAWYDASIARCYSVTVTAKVFDSCAHARSPHTLTAYVKWNWMQMHTVQQVPEIRSLQKCNCFASLRFDRH